MQHDGELKYYKDMDAYELAPISECWARTNAPPVGVRWIDHNKGDNTNEVYRSRLVGKQFKTGKNDELFAATPPLEAMKMVISESLKICILKSTLFTQACLPPAEYAIKVVDP